MGRISCFVPLKLALPVFKVGPRAMGHFARWAVVLMPEASMNEDDFTAAREDHIRPTGQRVAVKTITIAHGKNEAPYGKLGLHVLASNRPHHAATFLGRNSVHFYRRLRERFI